MTEKNSWPWVQAVQANYYDETIAWPKISIITPSFNQGSFIEETILSVLNQNYPNIEYIIIDGGSTDTTLAIIKKYEHQLFYWSSETDNGQTHAINKGLDQATGSVIGYLNSDDCLYQHSFSTIAKAFLNFRKTSDEPILLSGHALLGKDLSGAVETFLSFHKDWSLPEVAIGFGICPQPSTFWSANQIRFDEALTFCMDFDYWVRLIHAGYQVQIINENLSFYRIHESAKGNTMTETMWLEATGLCFKHAKLMEKLEDRLKVIGSSNYKLRNYFYNTLHKEYRDLSKVDLLNKTIRLVLKNPGACFNFNFLKFAITLLFR